MEELGRSRRVGGEVQVVEESEDVGLILIERMVRLMRMRR